MHLEVVNVSKSYGRTCALDDVSLEIPPGRIVAVLGSNGAGKTTLLRTLAGIAAPDRGTVRYDGEQLRRNRLDLRRRFFFLPDTPAVDLHMTVLQHIGMVVKLYEADHPGIEERIVELLDAFDMLPLCEATFRSLSRGQQYKGALVALLAVRPELWLFDEPFAAGIDPPAIRALRTQMRATARDGATVIYTTQIVEVAESTSDQVAVFHEGRLIDVGPINELRQRASESPALQSLVVSLEDS